MKKHLLYMLALCCIAPLGMAQYSRKAVPTGSGLKQVARVTPAEVKTKRLAAAAENAMDVPFSLAVGKDSPDADYVKANFTVINANNDSRTWNVGTTNKYVSCMAAKAGESDYADDWLISMPINLKAGSYKLTFDAGYMGASASGYTLEVVLGTGTTVADMKQTIAPEVRYTAKDQTSYAYDFQVAEDGVYYIGFHCMTSVDEAGATLLYSFGIEANAAAPANAVEVPFTHTLGKGGIVDSYTTNEDSRWRPGGFTGYTVCLAPLAGTDRNDDWLYTVPVHMTKGNYTLNFDASATTSTKPVSLAVMIGSEATPDAMSNAIAPEFVITPTTQTTYTYNFAVENDGYYYLGFHCTTTAEQAGALKLYNISVEGGETVVVDPPAAGTLTWVLAPKGELKATVTYTAPTKTVSGADLKAISKVELTSRWTVDKYEFTDVVPGQVIVQEVPMYQGINNRFTGVAYVDDVAGEMVEYKSIFCGKDTPLAPENIKLVTNPDYTTATLSWDAVGEVGENGGYVDPQAVTYYIFDAFGSYYDPAIAETSNTSVTLSYEDMTGQDFVAYQVTAGYEDNYSLDNASDIVIVGQPAELPFTESFANGLYEQVWALDTATDFSGQMYGTISDEEFADMVGSDDPEAPAPLKSFDGDNGFFFWMPYEKNVMVGLLSLRADISKAKNPVLDFRYQGQGSTIDVLVASGTGELKPVRSIDLKANPTDGWTLARIPLNDYKADGAVNFEIRLTATHNDDEYTWSVPVDYVTVHDLVDTDLRLVSASASATTVSPQNTITVKGHVQNQGTVATDGMAVLTVNGKEVASQPIATLATDEFADVELEYVVPLNAPEELAMTLAVVADGDEVTTNNEYSCTVTVKYAPYPTVTNLTAEVVQSNSQVLLTWEAPVLEGSTPVTITDDFESDEYEPFSISGVGGWTVYDGDGEMTINVFNETYNPNQTKPMAFQLFNKDLARPYYEEDCDPHSGSSFMLAPTSYYADNDNWLISPELSGNSQTISFYAKSFSIAWPESMEVLYSTTGNNAKTDFTADPLLTVEAEEVGWSYEGGVPETWTKYEVELPAGAKYFAIRHLGWYTCALYVDDVTYEGLPDIPADLELTGYHVMRDDVLLTTEPVSATTYTDNILQRSSDAVRYEYSVIPVYNYGVGRSEKTSVEFTVGVNTITADEVSDDAVLYNLQGVKVSKSAAVPGLYIMVKGNTSAKVQIR